MTDFLTRLEPFLHSFDKDELILMYVLWNDFQLYSKSKILDINIVDVCERAKITEERYNEIIKHFESLKILEVVNRSEVQNIEWVLFYLPLSHSKELIEHYRTEKPKGLK